ncbi:hypothetical protein E2562_024920 [Oryza meyeriana var. granulata]|uniref:Uncharacterized protein n=1 Tax=Oryza meyeriana var. granulata TaxID=110450 RepID=A0A6G1DLX7_9ORYZ|nr:hypothetical protein E2562_024920 [Oryza meyeriana var. granulata]
MEDGKAGWGSNHKGVSAEPANLPGESSTNPQWRILGGCHNEMVATSHHFTGKITTKCPVTGQDE